MGDNLKKAMEGTMALSSAEPGNDSEHVVRKHFTCQVRANSIGAAEEFILITELQADIKVTGFSVVTGLALAADANNPTVTLAKGNMANGALTDISSALDLADALAQRTQLAGTISTSSASRGDGLWLHVETQGTPADISEDTTLTFMVEYELAN